MGVCSTTGRGSRGPTPVFPGDVSDELRLYSNKPPPGCVDWQQIGRRLRRLPARCQNTYANLFAEGARQMGWKVCVQSSRDSVLRLFPADAHHAAPVVVRKHKVQHMWRESSADIMNDKARLLDVLESRVADFPKSKSVLITDPSQLAQVGKLIQRGKLAFPLVCKPVRGSQGKNVWLGMANEQEVAAAVREIWESTAASASSGAGRTPCLVEEQQSGHDYRALVLGGNVVEVVRRVPAVVIGDGVRTTEQLCRRHNRSVRVPSKLPKVAMAASCGPFDDVPPFGVSRTVQDKANVSLGGFPLKQDLATVHADNLRLFERCASIFPLHLLMGIDFFGDTRKSHKHGGGVILEVNGRPQMYCHCVRVDGTLEFETLQRILQRAATEVDRREAEQRRTNRRTRRHQNKQQVRGTGGVPPSAPPGLEDVAAPAKSDRCRHRPRGRRRSKFERPQSIVSPRSGIRLFPPTT